MADWGRWDTKEGSEREKGAEGSVGLKQSWLEGQSICPDEWIREDHLQLANIFTRLGRLREMPQLLSPVSHFKEHIVGKEGA